jgi:hypothetical protein
MLVVEPDSSSTPNVPFIHGFGTAEERWLSYRANVCFALTSF